MLALFLVLPIIMIVIVSFWGATEFSIYPAFQFDNYRFLFGSAVTWQVFGNTLRYALITWALTLGIGFTVAYFLAFHVRTLTWQITLALICTVPFWTSNIIRMISWVPFLGRNGIANSTLLSMGVVDQPVEWLLFSDFRGDAGLCPHQHVLHDRADPEHHAAHRQIADRGGARRRAPPARRSCGTSSSR